MVLLRSRLNIKSHQFPLNVSYLNLGLRGGGIKMGGEIIMEVRGLPSKRGCLIFHEQVQILQWKDILEFDNEDTQGAGDTAALSSSHLMSSITRTVSQTFSSILSEKP